MAVHSMAPAQCLSCKLRLVQQVQMMQSRSGSEMAVEHAARVLLTTGFWLRWELWLMRQALRSRRLCRGAMTRVVSRRRHQSLLMLQLVHSSGLTSRQQAAWCRSRIRLGRQAMPCLLMGLVAGSTRALWQQQWSVQG